MHYYQFNIGDYASHTARLSLMEDLAYRRLLDLYYLNERPLNGCSKTVAREIGMVEQHDSVDYILNKFFTKEGDSWVQKRADQEIKLYQNKKKAASRAGKASAKARQAKGSEQESNDRSTTVQPNINHKPLTINQEPLTKNQSKSKTTPSASLDYSSWPSIPDQQILRDWLSHRKQIKAPVSQTVVNSFGKELNLAIGNHFTVDQCLEECMNRGWRGFKAEWLVGKVNPKRPGGSTGGSSAREALQEWANSRMQGGAIEGEFSHE